MTSTLCPVCGSAATIPIVYGLPGVDLDDLSVRGEVRLGGCIIDKNFPDPDPSDACTSCDATFDALSGLVVPI
jgi:hypothetical protein